MGNGGFRAIIVDNDEHSMRVMQHMIEELVPDAEVHLFFSSEQAIEYAQKFAISVVFLETRANGLNGLSLAKRLKQIRPYTNLIFVTMYDQYRDEAIWLHASGYLLKPFSTMDVARQLTNLLYPVKSIAALQQSLDKWANGEKTTMRRRFFL